MPPIDNEKDGRLIYSCPNPNCKTVFAEPKIIKYYVCPICQTLVDESNLAEHLENSVASRAKKVVACRKSEIVEPDPAEFLEIGILEVETTKSFQSELEELRVTKEEAETEAGKKVIDFDPVQLPQQETTKALQPEQIVTAETEKTSEPSPKCQYGFGYLSHRESGAGIPETCIECPDSLNCMLSQYHRSGESVEEISKWYK